MHSPLPVFALLLNALIWGLSWWPFRLMHEAGLHPLWATAAMYALVLAGLLALRPASIRQAWQYPVLRLKRLGMSKACRRLILALCHQYAITSIHFDAAGDVLPGVEHFDW